MRLIIIRHGETTYNKNFIIQGQLDSKLSEEGIEQIKKVINDLPVTAILDLILSKL